jgi:hypothetical protein
VIWILFCLIIIFVHVSSKFPLHLECYLLSPKMHKKVSKKIKQSERYISITKKSDTYITLSDLSCYVSDLTVADTPFRGVVLCGKETRSYVCHLGAPLGWLPNVCIKVIKAILVCLFVCFMVFIAAFNNISVILWRSVLLVEDPEKTTDLSQVTDKL